MITKSIERIAHLIVVYDAVIKVGTFVEGNIVKIYLAMIIFKWVINQ